MQVMTFLHQFRKTVHADRTVLPLSHLPAHPFSPYRRRITPKHHTDHSRLGSVGIAPMCVICRSSFFCTEAPYGLLACVVLEVVVDVVDVNDLWPSIARVLYLYYLLVYEF